MQTKRMRERGWYCVVQGQSKKTSECENKGKQGKTRENNMNERRR